MKYYVKNGKVIARSYPTSYGFNFELGVAKDTNTAPCVMNSFFASSCFHLHSMKELRRAEKKLGDVVVRNVIQ